MKVLSLFDGISCARVALEKAGLPVEIYCASEVDEYAITIAKKNYPDTIHMGDVKKLSYDFEKHPAGNWLNSKIFNFDLLIGGSPCQDLSIAKNGRKGLEGDRSSLFWEYVRLLKETKPRYFILENVASMPNDAKKIISETLGVEPIMIDASLVSAQRRKRLFWTNIPNVVLPEDRHIYLQDIIEEGFTPDEKSYVLTASYSKKNARDYFGHASGQMVSNKSIQIGQVWNGMSGRVYLINGKSVALKALGGAGGAKTGLYLVGRPRGKNPGYLDDEKTPTLTSSSWDHNNFRLWLKENGYYIRKLTPIECERLQGVPDGYTEGVSNTQRYTTLGNAFNADVIAHILSFIP